MEFGDTYENVFCNLNEMALWPEANLVPPWPPSCDGTAFLHVKFRTVQRHGAGMKESHELALKCFKPIFQKS